MGEHFERSELETSNPVVLQQPNVDLQELCELQRTMLERHADARVSLFRTLHDLRAALLPVHGFAKLLMQGRAGELNPAQQVYVKVIVENAERISAALRESEYVLNSSAIELNEIDVALVWAEVVELCRPQLRRNRIVLTENLPLHPCIVRGDGERLTLVFHKLLVNAANNSQRGRIQLDLACAGGSITITVGTDVPANASEQGLISDNCDVVVSEIIRLHEGTISIRRQIDSGVWIATVHLPAIHAEPKYAEEGKRGQAQSVGGG
jgi:signal transduction histidine kinase